jgi:hypothetical protein
MIKECVSYYFEIIRRSYRIGLKLLFSFFTLWDHTTHPIMNLTSTLKLTFIIHMIG